MRRAFFVLAISLSSAALPGLATPAAAQPARSGPGTTAVKQANDAISALLKKKAPAAEVTKSVRAFLDIDQLGKSAMAAHWATLKKPDQDEFLKVLRELMETNYLNIQKANVAYAVEYTGESTNADGNIVVATKVKTQRRGRPFTISIDYVLIKHGASLQAFDVITDGASLVDNYRQMFNKVIKDKGFTGLMEKMKSKLAEIQKAAAPTKT
jgi:phospholipid transport system substrate-binding protein